MHSIPAWVHNGYVELIYSTLRAICHAVTPMDVPTGYALEIFNYFIFC